jgi:hypothetical protein
MYQNGIGLRINLKKAFEYYKEASNLGYVIAQDNLGYMYENGFGISKSLRKAFKSYRKASEQGYFVSTRNLGRMYENGYGTEKNIEKSLECYTKAKEQGFYQKIDPSTNKPIVSCIIDTIYQSSDSILKQSQNDSIPQIRNIHSQVQQNEQQQQQVVPVMKALLPTCLPMLSTFGMQQQQQQVASVMAYSSTYDVCRIQQQLHPQSQVIHYAPQQQQQVTPVWAGQMQQQPQQVAPVRADQMQVYSPMYANFGMQQQLHPQSQVIHHAHQHQQVQVSVNQKQETTSVMQIVQQIKKQSVEIQQENAKNEPVLSVLHLNSSSKTVQVMNPIIQPIQTVQPIAPIAVKRPFILDISDSCACSSAKKQIIIID